MYDELVKALRDMSKMGMKYGMAVVKMREAADAIEELNCNYQLALGSMKKEYKRANEAEKQKPRWIPVTERLPEDRRDVLVYAGVMFPYITVGYYDGLWKFSFNDEEIAGSADYWMPLPEPPKDEKIS